MPSITPTISAVADTANSPAAAWTTPENSIDGSNITAAVIGNLVDSSDFLDCTLGSAVPASSISVTNLSVTIKVSAVVAG